MTDFSATIAFVLIRRLAAAGTDTPSLYLLISDTGATRAIEADIAAEVQVQLGLGLRSLVAAEMRLDRLEEAFKRDPDRPVTLITLDHWLPKLVTALDRNVVSLTRGGAVLLLANQAIAERLLSAAPNLRNRLSDVLTIRPDEAFGGPMA
jgi:hypothetical protein